MKLNSKMLLATVAVAGIALAPAQAANDSHGPADLILTIQNPGGTTGSTTTGIAVLGTTASFRDAAAGSYTTLSLNLDSTLDNFGATWYNTSTLWLGAVDYRGNNGSGTNLLTQDPNLTLYVTKARLGVGTVGQANSVFDQLPLSFVDNTISNISAVKTQMENAATGVVNLFSTGGTDQVAGQNPVNSGVQGAGYTNINGGVQANFGAGSFGVMGAAGNVELALDLYRVQYINNISGQYGFGQANNGTGEYIGTLTVAQDGTVGYLKAVPEPSSMALVTMVGLGLFSARRRRSKLANA